MHDWRDAMKPATRIVVLHPHYRNARLLLWAPLQSEGSVYLKVTAQHISHQDILASVTHESAVQGVNQVKTIVLDEADTLTGDELAVFLRLMMAQDAIQVIVSMRVLPVALLADEELRRVTQFIPSSEPLLLQDYSAMNEVKHLLEVQAFGHGRVIQNGQPIDHWDGVLPRMLFFFLIDKGMVTRDEIFEIFWPTLGVREATNVFHVTKRKINEVLGLDLTIYRSGYYCISPDISLSYDVHHFNRLLQDSEISAIGQMRVLLDTCEQIYRGDFLSLMSLPWVLKRRDEMRQTYAGALYELGSLHAQQDEPEVAGSYFLRAYRHHPTEERYAEAVRLFLADAPISH